MLSSVSSRVSTWICSSRPCGFDSNLFPWSPLCSVWLMSVIYFTWWFIVMITSKLRSKVFWLRLTPSFLLIGGNDKRCCVRGGLKLKVEDHDVFIGFHFTFADIGAIATVIDLPSWFDFRYQHCTSATPFCQTLMISLRWPWRWSGLDAYLFCLWVPQGLRDINVSPPPGHCTCCYVCRIWWLSLACLRYLYVVYIGCSFDGFWGRWCGMCWVIMFLLLSFSNDGFASVSSHSLRFRWASYITPLRCLGQWFLCCSLCRT